MCKILFINGQLPGAILELSSLLSIWYNSKHINSIYVIRGLQLRHYNSTILFQSQSMGGLNTSSSSPDMASKVQSSTSDSTPTSEGGGTVTRSSGEVSKLGYLQYS